MPSHELHRKLNKLVLGRSYDEINKLLDFPYCVYGSRHRKLFHDDKTVAMIFALTGDINKTMAAALHIALDKADSRNRMISKLLKLI